MSHPTVIEIVSDSPAAEAGLSVGAELVAVNGIVPSDVIEYQQLVDDADPELTIRDGAGQRNLAAEQERRGTTRHQALIVDLRPRANL